MMEETMYQVREIDEQWNERMLSIIRESPVEASGLRIVFDHQPDIFLLPRLRSDHLKCAGFFVRDQLRGFAMLLTREMFVNGALRKGFYFGNLYVERSARGRGFLYRLSDLFLGDLPDPDRLGHSVIMQGNDAALGLLNHFHARYPNMPHSRIIGAWRVHNIVLASRLGIVSAGSTRHARMEDVDAIVELLQEDHAGRVFAPPVTRETILDDLERLPGFGIGNFHVAERDGEIAGVCSAWDMTPFRQNRVLRYGGRFAGVRALHRIAAPIFGLPRLPAEGGAFRDVTILDYAVRGRDPEIMQALLAGICREYRERRYHLLHFGCCADDPLNSAADRFISRPVVSDVLVFSRSKTVVDRFPGAVRPWIDMALL